MKEEKYIKTLRFNTRAICILIILLLFFLIMWILGNIFENYRFLLILNIFIIAYFTILEPLFSISFIYHVKKGRYKDYPKFFISYIAFIVMLTIVIICIVFIP